MTSLLLAAGAPEGGASLLDTLGINFMVLGTQVVIFVITFIVLSKILFGRILGNITRREKELGTSRDSLTGDREEAARLAKEYEEHMAKADKAAYDRIQEMTREGMEEAGRIVAEAETKARAEIDRARSEIASEKAASLKALRADVSRLTLEATSKILGAPPGKDHEKIVKIFVAERS